MSSRKDPFWEHVVKIRTDVWECNYCKKRFTGRPIRIKAHLGGISGMGVEICNSRDLPADVRQQAAEAIKKKKDPIDHVLEDTLEERRSEPSNKRQRGSHFVDRPIQGEVPPSDGHAFLGSHSQVHPGHYTTGPSQQQNLEHDPHHHRELPPSRAQIEEVPPSDYHAFLGSQVHPGHQTSNSIQQHNLEHCLEETLEERRSEPSNMRQRGSQVHPGHYTTGPSQQQNLEHDSHHRPELPPSLALGTKVIENSFFNLPPPHLVGREFILKLENILRDLELGCNNAIGIYGMGGVGKTALLLNLHHRICSNGNFGDVLWVTVPKDATIYELQEEIARKLKVQDLLKDVKDVRERAAILWKNLSSKGECILFLDDVWQHYELGEVGIPVGISGLKLVLTTRSLRICQQMRCKKMIKIKPLPNDEESFNLFLEHLEVKFLSPNAKQIALSIVSWCGGLPLAIVAIARSMRGDEGVYSWKVALKRLKEGSNEDEVMEKDVILSLKRSYDILPSRMQQCFIRCALLPFETRSALVLREFFIDEELVGESNSRKMKHVEGQQILDQLESSCLLDSVDGTVEMHRLIRRTALYILSQSCPSTIKSYVGNEGLPDNKSWACDQVLTLMLNFGWGLSSISSSFFQPLSNLNYLNLMGTDIIDLPEIISDMIQLTALVLRGCVELSSIPCLEKLKLLRKLDLSGCHSLSDAPLGLGSLVNLTYLDLRGTRILSLERRVLSKLIQLQYLALGFTISSAWEGAVRLNNIEVVHGFSYDEAVIDLAEFDRTLVDDCDSTQGDDYYLYQDSEEEEEFTWRKQVSIIHHILHRDLVHGTVNLPACPHLVSLVQRGRTDDDNGGNRLDFSPCPPDEETTNSLWIVRQVQEEISLPSSQLRYSLRKLKIFGVSALKYLFSIAATIYLENLQHLTVEQCWKLEGIVAAGSILPSGAFLELKSISISWSHRMKTVVGIELVSHLKKLQLIQVRGCNNIEEIIARSPQPNVGATFESLTKLKVLRCPKIKTLLKHELLLQLPKLEELDVGSCFGMEEIIGQPSMMITDGGFAFPTLKRLYLHDLPNLKHVYDGGLCSNGIITVHIKHCPMLKKFPFRMILNGEAPPSPPPYIEEIVISDKELYLWEALEWDHPDTKNILQPYLQLEGPSRRELIQKNLLNCFVYM